ncbi:MAG: hypothetical protein AB1422_16555 [bacterium]
MNSYSIKLRALSEKEVNWGHFVPEITFVLYLCDAIKEYVDTEEIANKAARTYPDIFSLLGGPDTYFTVMALKEAKSINWRYARGDVIKGWKLTQQGILFAKDVERRKLKKYKT